MAGGRSFVLHAHARAGLDPHLQADLDRAYWDTDEPAEVIARRFEIELVQPGKGTQRIPASTRLAEHVTPIEAPGRCPRCSTGLVYRSRADRRDDHRSCVLCGHRDPVATCPCRACVAERDERAEERYRYWRRHLCRPEFAAFALDDLDRDASSLYWRCASSPRTTTTRCRGRTHAWCRACVSSTRPSSVSSARTCCSSTTAASSSTRTGRTPCAARATRRTRCGRSRSPCSTAARPTTSSLGCSRSRSRGSPMSSRSTTTARSRPRSTTPRPVTRSS